MGIFRGAGKIVGNVAGTVIGEPLKFVGKKLDNEVGDFIENVGKGVKSASQFSFDSAGQALDGVWNTASGMIQKDELKKQDGVSDLKDVGGRTVKGVANTLKSAGGNATDVYKGLKSGDHQRAIHGAKKLGETVAVGVIAIGVIDIANGIDGIDGAHHVSAAEVDSPTVIDLDTPNEAYSDSLHPVTEVPLVEKEVVLPNGDVGIGTFPDFNEVYAVQLPEDMYLYSDDAHFSFANVQLNEAIATDTNLSSQFTDSQLQQINNGETPSGYTWHHHETTGRLELVDTETHHATGHVGGRELWGGGEKYR